MTRPLRDATVAQISVVSLVLLATAGTAIAGVQHWTTGGPPGAAVNELAVDPATPTTLYMVGHGVWKTADSGANWVRLRSGLTSADIRTVAVNPASPSVVLVGTFDAGVFRTTDGGASWASASQGLPSPKVLSLAIDTATPSVVYAGLANQGVYKSTDGGATWSSVNNGINGNTTVVALTIDPSAPQTVFAGSNGGMHKTVNGGASWSTIAGGLPPGSVQSITVDPTSSAIVYAGTEEDGLYKSIDSGATWSAAGSGLPAGLKVDSVAIDPTSPSTLYLASHGSSLFKSVDGAGSWTAAGVGIQSVSVYCVMIAETTPLTLYAGTYGQGVFKSTNGAASWVAANDGLEAAVVSAVVVDPATSGRLWAATQGGVWRTDTNGGSWSALLTGMPFVQVDSLARDPLHAGTFYAGTWRGLYKTTNGGASWSRTDGESSLTDFEAVAVDPVIADRVYSGSWLGLKVSANGGSSWTQPATGPIGMRVLSFAFDPQVPSTVYAGAWQGLFRSADSGVNWTSSLTDETIWSIAVDPATPSTLYVCTYDGVFKSTNGGASWHSTNTGITADYCWALAIDPDHPATVYQGSGAGVFRSTDGGAGWAPMTGLEEYDTYDLALSPDRNTLYAATNGGGVASYSFSGPTCSLDCSTIVPATSMVGSQVYFQAEATPTDCIESPSYEWSFGDGTAHAGTQNPSHTYTSAMSFQWMVTASADGASCTVHGTIAIDPLATTWYVPGVAHAPGAGGTTWRTDLAVVNRGPGAASGSVTFIPYDGSAPVDQSFSLGPGRAVEWRDVLVSHFHLGADSSTKGTVRIASSNRVFATARTYNQTATGTFGQYLPALPAVSARSRGASAGIDLTRTGQLGVIPQLKKSGAFRTNLGVQNIGGTSAKVEIRLFNGHGGQLGITKAETVAVGRYLQLDDVFAALGAGSTAIAYATVRVVTPDGAAWFYGSVVDNATGDPTTVPVLLPWSGDREIAGIAHAPGAGGTTWRSDVTAVNPGGNTVALQPRFTVYDGGATATGQASILAAGTVEWRDVAVSLFGYDQGSVVKGTMAIDAKPDLYLTARTYNQAAAGTFGQYLPAVTAAEGFGQGVVGTIPQLKKNASFRSNVGVLNLSPFDIVAAIRLFDSTGAQVGTTRSQAVPANEYFQVDDVFAALGAGNLDVAYATVEVMTDGGRIWAYGSVIDNATGDPTTIPALVP